MGKRRHDHNWLYAWPAGPLLKGLPGVGFLLSVSPSFQNNSVIFSCTYKQVGRAVREELRSREVLYSGMVLRDRKAKC